ncbi:MAG: DNA alkylation repair protein [Oscillospiraceae bacterium]|nr:DNA alkylation repair protein [Oscillospiraceae bacterium]MDY6208878.1 DNA alkylation repair protein [Oscillospiraceae bacterium]
MLTDNIRKELFENRDEKFQSFQARLIPNIPGESIIGVRTPLLRKMAKRLYSEEAEDFLADVPHKYFEENQLHFFILSHIKDYDSCVSRVEGFLPYVDNWATCDQGSFPIFAKHKEEILEKIKVWIGSEHTYTVRFAVKLLMQFFLDGDFRDEYAEMAAGVRHEDYYVKMMVAWYFATALAKQYDRIIPFFEERRLDPTVHRMAIQKAAESYRILDERTSYLKSLK